MKISAIVPAHNEEGCLYGTVRAIAQMLDLEGIPHEILIVNDNSVDRTIDICQELSETFGTVRYINNQPPNGFGFAVRRGLAEFDGEVFNVGGGLSNSLSLVEATDLCRKIAGKSIPVNPVLEERPGDIPIFITDSSRAMERTG